MTGATGGTSRRDFLRRAGLVATAAPGASADRDLDQSLVTLTRNRFLPAGSPACLENLDF